MNHVDAGTSGSVQSIKESQDSVKQVLLAWLVSVSVGTTYLICVFIAYLCLFGNSKQQELPWLVHWLAISISFIIYCGLFAALIKKMHGMARMLVVVSSALVLTAITAALYYVALTVYYIIVVSESTNA